MYTNHYRKRNTETPQTEPIAGREHAMARNNAGGYSFKITPWQQLDRFLIIGSLGGTYYVNARTLTVENAKVIEDLVKEDGRRVVDRIVEISDSGRAPSNDPALFALAIAAAADDVSVRKYALEALPKVARIGTHLFHFAEYVEGFRGWGRALRKAIANWYNEMPFDRLAMQAIKYRRRDGWSHRDLLRLAHPKTNDSKRNALYKWIVSEGEEELTFPRLLEGFTKIRRAKSHKEAAAIIREYSLPREVVPTEFLGSAEVWAALLENMPMTALIRNLNKMTAVGLLRPFAAETKRVAAQLTNEEHLHRARVHPITILKAIKVYTEGRGTRGSLNWTPVDEITDALNEAFHMAFKYTSPIKGRTLVSLDVSASMGWNYAGEDGILMAAEASAAMCMTIARVAEAYQFMAFSHRFVPLHISPQSHLSDILAKTHEPYIGGGTDCSLPMIWARENNVEVDNFVIYTDNETWYGSIHPAEALAKYRNATGIPARLIVNAVTPTHFSIADPDDAGMLDIAGFDSAVPEVLAQFTNGSF